MVVFDIPGEPKSKLRPRFGKFGAVRTPKDTVTYESYVKQLYVYGDKKPYFADKPLQIRIEAYFSIPKSNTKKMRQLMAENKVLPTKKPDADNIIKIICDSLNGIAYDDDKQIVDCTCIKRYTEEAPFVRVTIKEVTFEKVKAHSGDNYNDLADKTAKEVIEFALKTNTSEKAAVTTELTLEGAIHIFENSQLTTQNFTGDAVTATYVKALEGLYKMLPQKPEKSVSKSVYFCPACHQVVGVIGDNTARHCRLCGQALDWNDV